MCSSLAAPTGILVVMRVDLMEMSARLRRSLGLVNSMEQCSRMKVTDQT